MTNKSILYKHDIFKRAARSVGDQGNTSARWLPRAHNRAGTRAPGKDDEWRHLQTTTQLRGQVQTPRPATRRRALVLVPQAEAAAPHSPAHCAAPIDRHTSQPEFLLCHSTGMPGWHRVWLGSAATVAVVLRAPVARGRPHRCSGCGGGGGSDRCSSCKGETTRGGYGEKPMLEVSGGPAGAPWSPSDACTSSPVDTGKFAHTIDVISADMADL